MSAPTRIEQQHYGKLVGRTVVGIQWEEFEGQALPILVLNGEENDEHPVHAVVLVDPEDFGQAIASANYGALFFRARQASADVRSSTE